MTCVNDTSRLDPQPRERITAFLGKSPFFSAMSAPERSALAARGEVIALAPDARLFEQGDTGDAAYLILSGTMAVEVGAEGGRTKVATASAGELIGEIAAFSNRPRNASVFAETAARLLRIDRQSIRELTQHNPACAMNVIAELGARLDGNNSSIALMSQAANALAAGDFRPEMLSTLKRGADRFGHFATVFENMAAELTTKQQYLQEMNAAQIIQRSFLPRPIAAGACTGRFDVAARMLPAKSVGGDFYDYFMIDEATLGIAIGDVSGKGVPAAIFMSVTRTILRTIARQGGDPGAVLVALNALLAEDNSESMFVTLVFGRIDLVTGRFDHANAAHEEAFVIGVDGAVERLAPLGPAVGLFDGAGFGTATRNLRPGDTIVLGTDGITEAFDADGRMFGVARTEALLRPNAGETAESIVGRVMESVLDFSRGVAQSDDMTCLALRFLGD